jgi:hypothetical protein
MLLTELPRVPDPGRDYLGVSRLDCDKQAAEHEPFQQGYIAGWRSVRGVDDHPSLIPPSPVFVGPMMYMVGFSRGARDAGPPAAHGIIR